MVTVTSASQDPALPEWREPWEPAHGNATVATLFIETFGEAPVGTWSAPGQINLIGEHTDYSRGLNLPAILGHRTYVAGSRRDDRRLRVTSAEGAQFDGPGKTFEIEIDDISPATCEGWPAFVSGVIWTLIERGYDGPGLNLAFTSCIPLAVGLGSSAALACGAALAANDLWRLALDAPETRVDLAESARDAENLSPEHRRDDSTSTPPCTADRMRGCSSTAPPPRPPFTRRPCASPTTGSPSSSSIRGRRIGLPTASTPSASSGAATRRWR
jgi:galactokinase